MDFPPPAVWLVPKAWRVRSPIYFYIPAVGGPEMAAIDRDGSILFVLFVFRLQKCTYLRL